MQDAVAVGHIDNFGVARDLGDEVARVEIVGDGHAEAEDEGVGIVLENVFDAGLGVGVEAAAEVCCGFLGKGRADDLGAVGTVL